MVLYKVIVWLYKVCGQEEAQMRKDPGFNMIHPYLRDSAKADKRLVVLLVVAIVIATGAVVFQTIKMRATTEPMPVVQSTLIA